MNVKTYLGQAYRLDLNINSKIEQLESLRALAYKVTSTLSDSRVSGTKEKSPMENAVIKIIMAENEINKEIDAFVDIKREIANNIKLICNEEYRVLLELRYLCFNSWEEIAVKMKYSYSYVYKQHHYAVKDLEKVLLGKEVRNQ